MVDQGCNALEMGKETNGKHQHEEVQDLHTIYMLSIPEVPIFLSVSVVHKSIQN